jgi:hypothetical protein
MKLMALGELEFGIRDNSRELGRVQIHTGPVTAVTLPTLLTQVGTLRTAIDGLSIGQMATESLEVFNTKLSPAAAASPLAQRGKKWTVGYADIQPDFDNGVGLILNEGFGKIFTFTIPCADLTLLTSGEEQLDLTVNPALAFVTAFNATARSPYGGTVAVQYIRYID